MKIIDRVYGVAEIKEKILLDLVDSQPVQRLKGVFQFMPPKYYHKDSFTRYEHSLGVLFLLKKLGAGLEEQIAGLLHDISHTAFSHVIDWAIGDPTKEDYQDSIHLKSIEESDVPEILSKYGFDYKRVSNVKRFSLLEREAPDLCADRIDYALREFKMEGKDIDRLVDDLIVKDREIFFKTFKFADFFAREYTKLQKEHWAGKQARTRYYVLANILKEAMREKVISLENIVNGQDYEIISLLEEKGNDKILRGLNLLKGEMALEDTDSERGILLEKKFRYIDPKILINGEGKNLSEISWDYKLLLENEKQNSKRIKRILIKET